MEVVEGVELGLEEDIAVENRMLFEMFEDKDKEDISSNENLEDIDQSDSWDKKRITSLITDISADRNKLTSSTIGVLSNCWNLFDHSELNSDEANELLLLFREKVLMDENENLMPDCFQLVQNQEFLLSLQQMLSAFWTNFPSGNVSVRNSPYQSHQCYEIGLHIFLSILENITLVKDIFTGLQKISAFYPLMTLLCKNLSREIAYHTQELALEIICRFCLFLKRFQFNQQLQFLLDTVPPLIGAFLKDKDKGPFQLIQNMRPTLNDVNKMNPYLSSYKLLSVSLLDDSNSLIEELQLDSWLDIGLTQLTVELPNRETMLRIPVNLLKRVHFTIQEISMTIVVENFSHDVIASLQLQHNASPSKSANTILKMNFGTQNDLEEAQSKIKHRLSEAAITCDIERSSSVRQKLSVATLYDDKDVSSEDDFFKQKGTGGKKKILKSNVSARSTRSNSKKSNSDSTKSKQSENIKSRLNSKSSDTDSKRPFVSDIFPVVPAIDETPISKKQPNNSPRVTRTYSKGYGTNLAFMPFPLPSEFHLVSDEEEYKKPSKRKPRPASRPSPKRTKRGEYRGHTNSNQIDERLEVSVLHDEHGSPSPQHSPMPASPQDTENQTEFDQDDILHGIEFRSAQSLGGKNVLTPDIDANDEAVSLAHDSPVPVFGLDTSVVADSLEEQHSFEHPVEEDRQSTDVDQDYSQSIFSKLTINDLMAKHHGNESIATDKHSGGDDDNIYFTLLQELGRIQKERVMRRQNRQMMNAAEAACKQVDTFLSQWHDYTLETNKKLVENVNSKINVVCSSIEILSSDETVEVEQLLTEQKDLIARVVRMEESISILQQEIAEAVATMRLEEKALMANIIDGKKNVLASIGQFAQENQRQDVQASKPVLPAVSSTIAPSSDFRSKQAPILKSKSKSPKILTATRRDSFGDTPVATFKPLPLQREKVSDRVPLKPIKPSVTNIAANRDLSTTMTTTAKEPSSFTAKENRLTGARMRVANNAEVF